MRIPVMPPRNLIRTRMIRLSAIGVAQLFFIFFISSGHAQQLGSFDRLLSMRNVQTELELSDAQILRLEALQFTVMRHVNREMNSFQKEMQKDWFAATGSSEEAKLKRQEREQASAEFGRKMSQYIENAYTDVLLDFQMKRLRELQIQQLGVYAFKIPSVRESIGMTDADFQAFERKRTENFRLLQEETKQAWRDMVNQGFPKEHVKYFFDVVDKGPREIDYAIDVLTDEQIELVEDIKKSRTKLKKREAELHDELIDMLTDEQRKAWRKLQGAKFDFGSFH